MAETPTSLAEGFVPDSGGITVLYECQTGKRVEITLMDFANTHTAKVTLNISKKVGSVTSRISPPDFKFGSKYLAQEDGIVTLEATHQIIGVCSIPGVVEYHLNGIVFDV